MTKLDFPAITALVGHRYFAGGMNLYLEGNVRLDSRRAPLFSDRISVSGSADDYTCRADVFGNGRMDCYCECQAWQRAYACAHIAALLIKYAVKQDGSILENADQSRAQALIAAYTPAKKAEEEAPVRITPVLSFSSAQPLASFRIGREHAYLIKGIIDFARRMQEHETYRYGERFVYDHDPSEMDARSQRLCLMICQYADGFYELLSRKRSLVQEVFGDVKEIPLSGESFDAIFDLFLGEKLPCREGGSVLLTESEPSQLLCFSREGEALSVTTPTPIQLYESGRHTYLYMPEAGMLQRLSDEAAGAMLPMLRSLSQRTGGLKFTPRLAEQFCQRVLPRISEYANPQELTALEPYMPGVLTVRFLLDMPERGLMTCAPNFTYEGRFVECGAPDGAYPDIRRNMPAEEEALSALEEWFTPPEPGEQLYTLTDEGRMYELLKDGGQQLAPWGEVFISDRLRSILSGRTPKPVVRARIKNGMLDLSLDTDEFPQDELDDLMRCVREKRRYYRLKDGSFMDLSDGRFSAFAQASENLGVSPSELAKRGALVPLYKALFLDEALKQDEGVQLEKDTDYRRLLRDFKTVEESDFPIPEGLDSILREYQKTGYRWLRTLDKYGFGGILADDMGLGKTLQVLAFLKGLHEEGSSGPALIACPASVLISWGSEIQKWVPELKSLLLVGNSQERALKIAGAWEYDIVVTSYDTLRNDIDLHCKNLYRVCVLDEAQYIKNRETKLYKSVKQLNARTRLALTGTPVENRLSELYNIFDFIMPGYLGSLARFRERYETPITDRGDPQAKKALTTLVHPFILRRMKKDVLTELPPKTETNCYIQMGERQRKLYAAYAAETQRLLESARPQDRIKVLSMLTRLRQICCDPALCVEGYEEDSCKLDECERMVAELIENEHRVLIFSQFTTMLSRIESRLRALGIASFTLQGDTPVTERARLVNAFNAGQCPVFLISLKAGGTGLNLTGADTVIHYDPWWNLAAQNQATDRCYRIGQNRSVQVYKLIASDTIEENIVRLQYKKLDLAQVVSENSDGGLMHMSTEELLALLK